MFIKLTQFIGGRYQPETEIEPIPVWVNSNLIAMISSQVQRSYSRTAIQQWDIDKKAKGIAPHPEADISTPYSYITFPAASAEDAIYLNVCEPPEAILELIRKAS